MSPLDTLHLAFSPCPNDTFMFHAMVHGRVDTGGLNFAFQLHDIDLLNEKAFAAAYDVTKLSFFAFLRLRRDYDILDSGAALGFGCGPLLVAKDPERFTPESLIAIPGELTTAHLLLKLWQPGLSRTVVTRFDNILEGVSAGIYDAGLIIHEGRFVYQHYGCHKIVDLGRWWEDKTGLPIPLGCIAIKKSLPAGDYKKKVENAVNASISYAIEHPEASRAFIRENAREIEDEVIAEHINLYVNEFSLSLGKSGREAVTTLEEMARWAQIL